VTVWVWVTVLVSSVVVGVVAVLVDVVVVTVCVVVDFLVWLRCPPQSVVAPPPRPIDRPEISSGTV
jgi:O-antigen ligase